MKILLFITLAIFAITSAYEIDDIPDFMKARLDKYLDLNHKWEEKWYSMSIEDREFFEKMIYDRLQHVPEHIKSRMRNRVQELEPEDQEKLREYLFQRFPELQEVVKGETVIEQINGVIEKLPDILREKISDFISIRFAPATAYENVNDLDFIDFPNVPDLIEIPEQGEGVPYSEDIMEDEALGQIDDFLVTREDWKRRWENLPVDKREVFEQYIFDRWDSKN